MSKNAPFCDSTTTPKRQIIPDALGEYLGDPDPAKAGRALQTMLQINKIVIADLRAHDGD